MKQKFMIAVITPSSRLFNDFLRMYTVKISDSIKFLHVKSEEQCRGIHYFIGYIELYDAHELRDLDKIRYSIEVRRIKTSNIKR